MSTARGRRDKQAKEPSVKDLFAKVAAGGPKVEALQPVPHPPTMVSTEGEGITKAYLESLFTTLREDLKKDLTAEIREVRRDIDSVGERVQELEDKSDRRDVELEALGQEVGRIHDQQVDLQAHLEDLENRSRRHNIRIRGVKTGEEGEDIFRYVQELFNHVLGRPTDTELRMDRAHRVGAPRQVGTPPADILVCIQDFRTKENILQKARQGHPISFKGQSPILYQDLAALTLEKRRTFRPVTAHLRQLGITYSWGHPFRIIFRKDGKLFQLRSLTEACTLLGLEPPGEAMERGPSGPGDGDMKPQWTQQRRRRRIPKPDPDEISKGQRDAVDTLAEGRATATDNG